MPTNSGVHPGPLQILEETLWEWTIAQERSCRLWAWADAPWWYGERASISTLAGAIWRSGGIAIEEYSVIKANPDSKKKGKQSISGRNDLYFKIGRSDFVLEAKQFWPNIRSKDVVSGLRTHLHSAIRDVRAVNADGARRLAAVFVAGRIPVAYMDDSEDLIETMIDALETFKDTARAWIFPERTEKLIDGKKTKKWYPGAAIVVADVGR